MREIGTAVGLLVISNVFMTFAWYGHLRTHRTSPWLVAALVSWGVAFFEYLFQVPANRIGARVLTVPQLKILQEVITLAVSHRSRCSTSRRNRGSTSSGPGCAWWERCTSCSAGSP